MKPAALLLPLLAIACRTPDPLDAPHAPGFDAARSDPEAVAVADDVLARLGGRAAWNDVGAVRWTFFGARTLVWDRRRGRCRVESPERTVVCDLASRTGRAWDADGHEITLAAEHAEALDQAHRAWVNDSYWLAMPYKLTDAGVTLRWVGELPDAGGVPCRAIDLTFADVGYTPENRYRVYVGPDDLVRQWDFYARAEDEEPRFSSPWTGWERHGDVWLSGGRGARSLTEIAVYDDLPEAALLGPEPFDPAAWPARPVAREAR